MREFAHHAEKLVICPRYCRKAGAADAHVETISELPSRNATKATSHDGGCIVPVLDTGEMSKRKNASGVVGYCSTEETSHITNNDNKK